MDYISRTSEPIIFQSFERSFITAILGPRRVGKSSLITAFIASHPKQTWVTLNMDILAERTRVERGELSAMIEEAALMPLGHKKIWVAIDEAQKCPALFEQIKIIYDKYKDKHLIKFILTGSALLQLHQLSAETLAGRIELYELHAFNCRETARLKQPDLSLPYAPILNTLLDTAPQPILEKMIASLRPFRAHLNDALHTQLIYGGLPEVLLLNTEQERQLYLRNYIQTYLEKDVRDITTITDLKIYQDLMAIIATQTGSLQDDQKILNSLACSRTTLKKYRYYLIATLLVSELYPYIPNIMKRMIKSPKTYLLDNGLVNYLMGTLQLNVLQQTGIIGHRFETWCLNELTQWLSRDPSLHHLHFWRASTGIEVDFVIDKKSVVLPFEATYSNQIDKKKLRSLTSFLELEPKAPFGVYIYMGDYRYEATKRIFYLPAWALG
jgi:predicted AAA+ superfamily ATPase